ncbi:MAG: hypothetical protein JWP56_660 [Aeromicrobium sp.]|nr:hypothetical protein [Aeromicrobium sp.]
MVPALVQRGVASHRFALADVVRLCGQEGSEVRQSVGCPRGQAGGAAVRTQGELEVDRLGAGDG